MKNETPINFTQQEIDDIQLMVDFNTATDDAEYKVIKLGGKEYGLWDKYCKNPTCSCTDPMIILVEIENEAETDHYFSFNFDYENKEFSNSEKPLPADLREELSTDEFFSVLLKWRHARIKLAFAQLMIQQKQNRMKQLINPASKIGRNEPCTCGSGRKYKNCCGK